MVEGDVQFLLQLHRTIWNPGENTLIIDVRFEKGVGLKEDGFYVDIMSHSQLFRYPDGDLYSEKLKVLICNVFY